MRTSALDPTNIQGEPWRGHADMLQEAGSQGTEKGKGLGTPALFFLPSLSIKSVKDHWRETKSMTLVGFCPRGGEHQCGHFMDPQPPALVGTLFTFCILLRYHGVSPRWSHLYWTCTEFFLSLFPKQCSTTTIS